MYKQVDLTGCDQTKGGKVEAMRCSEELHEKWLVVFLQLRYNKFCIKHFEPKIEISTDLHRKYFKTSELTKTDALETSQSTEQSFIDSLARSEN